MIYKTKLTAEILKAFLKEKNFIAYPEETQVDIFKVNGFIQKENLMMIELLGNKDEIIVFFRALKTEEYLSKTHIVSEPLNSVEDLYGNFIKWQMKVNR